MDGGKANDDSGEGNEERKSRYRREKPPDKRRHQMEMNHYTELIQKKEALLKSLGAPKSRKSSSISGNRDELLAKLRTLRSEKEEKMKKKQVIDVELKSLNQQVLKKNETCMKLQANVKYKDEQRTNNAIKHLERHLSTHQLKLSEEKKVVCEIDALKRSKKTLSEYLCAKQEVDQLRQRQNILRSERDTLIRETHDIKARENDVKVSLDSLKEENKEVDVEEKKPAVDRDALKKEIDNLYEKRRELHENYKQALAFYREEQKQIEKDLQQLRAEQRRDETRLTKITADRTRPERRHEPKPYEDEKNICVCLIQYLEPLIAQSFSESDEVDGNKVSPKYLEVPKCEGSIQEDGSFVMKKDDNLGGLFVQSNRRMTRKGSRKGRKSKDFSQKLVLHPHVFEQFLELNLEPPSTYADVSGMLVKLRDKKDWYEKESSKSCQMLPVISENVAHEGMSKADIRFIDDVPSDSQRFKNQPKNVWKPASHASDLSWHEQDPKDCETKQGKHEIKKPEHEIGGIEHQLLKDKLETEHTRSETEQAERVVGQLEHERDEAEHVTIKEEREIIKTLYENDENAYENDEAKIFKNERSSCKGDEICAENMLNKVEGKDINEDNSKEVLNFNPIISDALEKGMDSINIKETSKEIEVRVT